MSDTRVVAGYFELAIAGGGAGVQCGLQLLEMYLCSAAKSQSGPGSGGGNKFLILCCGWQV